MKILNIDLLDGGMPIELVVSNDIDAERLVGFINDCYKTKNSNVEVKTKIGESSGRMLYSVDGNVWLSTQHAAIDAYERKQRIVMEKINERD